MKIETPMQLKQTQAACAAQLEKQTMKVLVCAGTGCVAGGSVNIYNRLVDAAKSRGLSVQIELKEEPGSHIGVKKSGCHGFCEMGPLVMIEPEEYFYIKVKAEDCEEIVEQTLIGGRPVERLLYKMDGKSFETRHDIPFYKKQMRVVLAECGHMDAESVDEYIAKGGYSAFSTALFDMSPEDVIQQISDSGLRGRGGGGFPTGRKWQQVARQKELKRYVVCNGDEGDPGAFMDRSIMEGNPHSVLEGMMIAGYATGSDEGYIY
ncbi:MAG: NAD(P)H-dependent oxidoreductase subunit E, partial [Oscillospiraceae bacterium]|nr:NAD(P)H-dependent oxidoreductase subunit E [Oscillospiraceae bacterium]